MCIRDSFGIIKESAVKIKKQRDDNTVSLNEADYRKELEEANATSKKLEEIQKKVTSYDIVNPKQDMDKVNADSTSITKNNEWIKNLKKDIYLSEAVNIINDMVKHNMKVNLGPLNKQ